MHVLLGESLRHPGRFLQAATTERAVEVLERGVLPIGLRVPHQRQVLHGSASSHRRPSAMRTP